jgi:O-antigen ligase
MAIGARAMDLARPSERRWPVRLAQLGLIAHAAFLPISMAGMQIGLGFAVLGLIAARLSGQRVGSRSPLDAPLVGFCAAAVFSLLGSTITLGPPVGWHEATLWRSFLAPIAILWGLELPVGSEQLGSPEEVRRRSLRLLAIWAVAALIPSALAWVQHYTGLDLLHAVGLRDEARLAPAPRYPGHFAAMGFFRWYQRLAHNLTPVLCLCAGLVLYGKLPSRLRKLLAVGCLATAAAVVLTVSRAAWAGLAVAGVILAAYAGPKVSRWAIPAAILGALLVGFLHPGVRARLTGMGDPTATGDREIIWQVCAGVVKDNPVVGVGWGNLPQRSQPYYDKVASWYPLRAWCHNSFFSVLAEGGPLLLGALVFFWFALWRAFSRWRRAADPLGAAACAGAVAGLAAMFVNSLAHDILYASETMYGLAFMIAVAAALARAVPRDHAVLNPSGVNQ